MQDDRKWEKSGKMEHQDSDDTTLTLHGVSAGERFSSFLPGLVFLDLFVLFLADRHLSLKIHKLEE